MVAHRDVSAARAGDRAAFERLVQVHGARIHAITTAIVGDPQRGLEVAQDAFVHAWQGLRRLRNPGRFDAWLRRIARNRAHDVRRRDQRMQRQDLPADVVDPAPDAVARLEGAAQEKAVWDALDELPASHREVLVLFYTHDQSVREVAQGLGLSEAAVRKRLSRARDALRRDVADRLEPALAEVSGRGLAASVAVAIVGLSPASARAGVASAALVAVMIGLAVSVVGWTGLQGARAALPPEVVQVPRDRRYSHTAVLDSGSPRHVIHAVLAAEDTRFYEHGAIDPWSTARATWHNLFGEGAGKVEAPSPNNSRRHAFESTCQSHRCSERSWSSCWPLR